MSKLPTVSGNDAIRAFAKIGFVRDRVRGSHHMLKREGDRSVLTVPVHGNAPLKPGTLRSLIRKSGATVDEFCGLLE